MKTLNFLKPIKFVSAGKKSMSELFSSHEIASILEKLGLKVSPAIVFSASLWFHIIIISPPSHLGTEFFYQVSISYLYFFFNSAFSASRIANFLVNSVCFFSCSIICSVSSSTFASSFACISPTSVPFCCNSLVEGKSGRCLFDSMYFSTSERGVSL